MKKLIILIIYCLTAGLANAQELQYNINGFVKNASNRSLAKLLRWDGEKYNVCDSTTIINSKFYLSGHLCHPEVGYIVIDHDQPYPIFLNNETFFINADLAKNKSLKIKGSNAQAVYTKFQFQLDSFDILLEQLDHDYTFAENTRRIQQAINLQAQIDSLHIQRLLFIKTFVLNNYTSDAAPFITKKHLFYNLTDKELKHYVNLFFKNLSYEPIVVMLNEQVSNKDNTAVGAVAPFISLPDNNGQQIDLEDLRGKFVLINFWASWCNPCRKEAAQLVSLYNKYKDKNIEFLSISVDTDKLRWQKAIKEDEYQWPQCSDLKGWQSPVVKTYSVNNIPYMILINPAGKIIAKQLTKDNIDIELQQIMH